MSLSIRCEIYGFSTSHVWMWELDHKENWFPNNWWFWTVVLEKTPRDFKDSWTARRSNQSILKETSPKYSLEGLMLKLKLQYFGHLMRRTDTLETILRLGKIEGRRRRGRQGWDGWMASPTQWIWVWAAPGDGEEQGSLDYCSPWVTKRQDWVTKQHQRKTEAVNNVFCFVFNFLSSNAVITLRI